jgi:tetratricopeptide (TPR) repeat protein
MWFEVLAFVMLSGAFGGILAAIRPITRRSEDRDRPAGGPADDPARRAVTWTEVWTSALGGIGGAVAGLSLMLVDKKIDNKCLSDIDRLVLICMGTIAGFLGFQLLQLVADRFNRAVQRAEEVARKEGQKAQEAAQQEVQRVEARVQQVARDDKQAAHEEVKKVAHEEVKKETAEALKDQLSRIQLVTAIGKSLSALQENSSSIPDAIKELEEARTPFPDDRSSAIVLGRLYRRREDYPSAIRVLTDVLEAMRQRGTTIAKNESDILFNRAIYYHKLSEKEAGPEEKKRLQERAYEDLERCIKLAPENAEAARLDDDFKNLWEEPKFKELTARS